MLIWLPLLLLAIDVVANILDVSFIAIVFNLILVFIYFFIIIVVLSLVIILLETWLEVEIVHVLIGLELKAGAVALSIHGHSLFFKVCLLLLLRILAGFHPLEIILHLHVLKMNEERVDGRCLLLLSRVWKWSSCSRVLHIWEKLALIVSEIHLIHLGLSGRLGLVRNIRAVIHEHCVVVHLRMRYLTGLCRFLSEI